MTDQELVDALRSRLLDAARQLEPECRLWSPTVKAGRILYDIEDLLDLPHGEGSRQV